MTRFFFLNLLVVFLSVALVTACTESRSGKSGGTASVTQQTTRIEVPTWYYAHFGADYSLDVPAEGFGGWKKTVLPLSLEHTALCVMHAWDNPDQDLFPGIYSAVEYLPRAAEIYETRMPSILKAFRDAGVRVIHIEIGRSHV